MNKIIKILLFCIITTGVYASPYPISPCPLRKLVIDSDVIVVGNVISIYKKEPKKKKKNISYTSYSYARIVVKEILQGKISNDTLDVPFSPNMICPSPARYFEKTTVLAFLDADKDKDGYHTHALSYGAKTMDSTGIDIYRKRILEVQDIQKIADQTLKQNETIEWLVKCAENAVTCWEGVFELSPESDFMSFYSTAPVTNMKSLLTVNQKERLKNAFLSSADFGYYDFGLCDLIYEENQKQIDEFLLKELKKLSPEKYWYATDFMMRLKHLNTSSETENLLKMQDEIELKYNNNGERKIIIDQFIALVEKQ